MIHQTQHLGHNLTLILDKPDWSQKIEIKHRIADDIEEGRTGRENRRPRHAEIRHEITLTYALDPIDAQAWQTRFASPLDGYIGIPMPMDRLPAIDYGERIYNASYTLALPGGPAPTIHVTAGLNTAAFPAGILLAPLFVGRLKSRPVFKTLTDMHARVTLTLLEESPWAFRIAPATPSGSPPPLDWPEPVTANWSTKPEDSTSDILDFTAIGNARVKSVDGQEGVVRRAQKFTATLDGREQIRALLAFFLARKGRVEAFTAPWLFRPSDVDTEAVPHATRARFADDTLTLTWLTDEAANAKISLLQVPWEINTPAGEAPVQPAEAYLYRFEADVPGVPVVWRYTDWEHDLARTENGVIVSYKGDTTGLIEHDGITQTSDLGDKATRIIMSANVPGNPLALVSANGIDVPVTIEIYRCNPANAEGAALVYSGSLTEVSEDGGKLTAETLVLGGLLRVKVPGFVFSPSCNHRFCRAGCTLDIATWTLSGLIVGQVGSELTAQITGNPNGRPLSGDFYARGVLIAGAGEGWEIRQIVRNTHLPDGKMKFVLKAPLRNAPAGLAVTFRPDCDGSISACQARQNFVNFGGHPHMGPANLSIPQRQTNTSGGKK